MKNSGKPAIAIVHDIFTSFGGSEYVAGVLAATFPDAHIYTSWIDPANPAFKVFAHRVVKAINPYHPLSIFRDRNFIKPILYPYWESLDLRGYDIVISSSHAYSSKAVITGPDTLHLCYCHTPPKYLWAQESESRVRSSGSLLVHSALGYTRLLDFAAGQRPDVMIANSHEVQRRIAKYYRRDAIVIYPPVPVPTKLERRKKQPYYVSLGRLSRMKGTDCLIRACNKLHVPLVVAGEGGELPSLKRIAGPTIRFTGFLPENQKAALLGAATALLFAGRDEDFGITPVEAMGQGTPVIALRSGGTRETVISGKTGLLVETCEPGAFSDAILEFKTMKFSARTCYNHARRFSVQRFQTQIKALIGRYS